MVLQKSITDGEKLAQLQYKQGLTKIAMVEALGIARATYDKLLEEEVISQKYRVMIAEKFNLSSNFWSIQTDDTTSEILDDLKDIKARMAGLESEKEERSRLIEVIHSQNQLLERLRDELKKLK